MSDKETMKRMQELFEPIEQQILMCDSAEEVLMLASVMLTKTITIFDAQIGEAGRREIINGYGYGRPN